MHEQNKKTRIFSLYPHQPYWAPNWSFSTSIMYFHLLVLFHILLLSWNVSLPNQNSVCSSKYDSEDTSQSHCRNLLIALPLAFPWHILYLYNPSLTWPYLFIRENFIIFEGINCLIHLCASLLPLNIWQRALHRVKYSVNMFWEMEVIAQK